MLKRRKKQVEQPPEVAEQPPAAAEPDYRSDGPWDSSEKVVDGDDPTYLDLGALTIHGRVGIEIQLPTDGDSDVTGAVVMTTQDAGLEMRAFASTRSGGLWAEVRAELIADVDRLEGQVNEVDGIFGPELHVQLPVNLPDGEAGVQPSRIVGIEGPRWFLRATFLGQAALEPSDEGLLIECLRDTIVNRGSGPMAPRAPLVINVPHSPVVADDSKD